MAKDVYVALDISTRDLSTFYTSTKRCFDTFTEFQHLEYEVNAIIYAYSTLQVNLLDYKPHVDTGGRSPKIFKIRCKFKKTKLRVTDKPAPLAAHCIVRVKVFVSPFSLGGLYKKRNALKILYDKTEYLSHALTLSCY